MAIISLIIGIIVLVTLARIIPGMPLGIPGLPLPLGILGSFQFGLPAGIVGLVLGSLALRKRSRRGIAIAGTVLNMLVVLWFVAVSAMWCIVGD